MLVVMSMVSELDVTVFVFHTVQSAVFRDDTTALCAELTWECMNHILLEKSRTRTTISETFFLFILHEILVEKLKDCVTAWIKFAIFIICKH